MRMWRETLIFAGMAVFAGVGRPAAAGLDDKLLLHNLECDDYELKMIFQDGKLVENLSSVVCSDGPPTPPTATPGPSASPSPTATPATGGCNGTALDKVVGDNWFGFDNVQLAEGQQIRYCATLGRQASMLRFTAYDMSDRRCGSAEIRVRQIGNAGWSKKSGFSAAPGVTMVGSGLIGNPTLTAAGAYEVTLVGGHTNEGCTKFRIGWKPT